MRNISDKGSTENQNTHFVFSNFFENRIFFLLDNVEKYFAAGQATGENAAHACCMLGT
jgi:hypothetical protein